MAPWCVFHGPKRLLLLVFVHALFPLAVFDAVRTPGRFKPGMYRNVRGQKARFVFEALVSSGSQYPQVGPRPCVVPPNP